MKLILPFVFAAAIASAADAPSGQSALPQITKKRHEHRDANGRVDAFADTFYRGVERILIQATYTMPKPSGIKMWREFVVDGKTVLKELDYGKRKPQMVWVYRDGSIYEAFRRHADGSIEPIASEDLAKARREVEALMTGFERVMERVTEGVERGSDQHPQKERTRGGEK
jgi:hypothetical protein